MAGDTRQYQANLPSVQEIQQRPFTIQEVSMKKVLDKELEKKLQGIIEEGGDASQIIVTLKELQDASGLKVCTAVTKTDPAYRPVK